MRKFSLVVLSGCSLVAVQRPPANPPPGPVACTETSAAVTLDYGVAIATGVLALGFALEARNEDGLDSLGAGLAAISLPVLGLPFLLSGIYGSRATSRCRQLNDAARPAPGLTAPMAMDPVTTGPVQVSTAPSLTPPSVVAVVPVRRRRMVYLGLNAYFPRSTLPNAGGLTLGLAWPLHPAVDVWADVGGIGAASDGYQTTTLALGANLVWTRGRWTWMGTAGIGRVWASQPEPMAEESVGLALRASGSIGYDLTPGWSLWLQPLGVESWLGTHLDDRIIGFRGQLSLSRRFGIGRSVWE